MALRPDAVSLAGTVAVVTGGGAGLGRGIAAGLAAFGADVASFGVGVGPGVGAFFSSQASEVTTTRAAEAESSVRERIIECGH